MRTHDRTGWIALWIATLALPFGACSEERETATHPTERTESKTATMATADGEDALEVIEEMPEEIRVGEEFTFTVRVKNIFEKPVEGVVVRGDLPEGFELLRVHRSPGGDEPNGDDVANAPDGEMSAAPRDGQVADSNPSRGDASRRQGSTRGMTGNRWTLGTLEPEEEITLEIVGLMHREGQTDTCLEVDYDSPFCSTWNVVEPELTLDMNLQAENEDDAFWICDEISAIVHLQNTGSGTTDAGQFVLELPEGLETTDGESRVAVDFDALDQGGEVQREIRLRASRGGSFVTRVQVRAGDQSLLSKTSEITVRDPKIDLTVDPLSDASRVGSRLGYRVTVANNGEAVAEDLALVVAESKNLEDIQVTRGQLEGDGETFQIGTLEPGQRREFRFSARAADVGKTTLRLRVAGRCLESEGRQVVQTSESEVKGVPAVRIEAVDQTDPVKVGENTTYSIQVKNQGSADDLNVRLTAELPENFELVESEGDTDIQNENGKLTLGPIERLAAGETASWKLTVKAKSKGEVRLVLKLQSDAFGGTIREEEPTTIIE
ncbi:MAG: hypothetical protein RL885_23770 [Planctomycetota bacterium]